MKAIGEESTTIPTSPLLRKRVFSCRHCSREFSTHHALGGHQNAHNNKKKPLPTPKPSVTDLSSIFALQHSEKLRRLAPRPPISFGPSSTKDLQHSSISVFQPIANNGPPIILQAIAHNRPVTMIGNGGQKGVVGLEGSCHCFVPPCRKDGQMGIQSSCATTVVSEEEEDLDLSLHL